MIIGSLGYAGRRFLSVSSPSISGISTSSVTTSGLSWGTFCSAILPLAAAPTISRSGSADRASVTSLRMMTASSTTRTRILATSAHQSQHAELVLNDRDGEGLHDVFVGARIHGLRDVGHLRFGGDHHPAQIAEAAV